jgi:acyl-CoA synthetase (AMP-forming)/AMP-acid ligase II
MRNSFRAAELIWAGHWTGAVPVPVNWRLAAPEVAAIVADAGCRAIVLDPEFVPLLDHPGLAAWRERTVVAAPGGGLPEYDRLLAAG